MGSWNLAVALDSTATEPLFLQIARAIADDVRRGRLGAGAALPGTRSLATSLSVHRNTVLAAYRELESQGWIRADGPRGTHVSDALPEASPRAFARSASPRALVPPRLGFDLPEPGESGWESLPDTELTLAGGLPDLRLVPTEALARAYRRVLRKEGRRLLDYGEPRGHVRLRRALAGMLSQLRGLAASEETVFVTRGSQMALDLVARAVLRPGDVVAVEELGYRPAWAALRAAGARLVPVPLDSGGLRVDALLALAERERVRAVYVTPHHQYPSTVTMPAGRRLELLELARAKRIAIFEDDYDNEFHYEGRPVLPLASADRAGVVVYLGTLSKVLAPGLRLGFLVAPEPLLERVRTVRALVDRQGDLAMECAIAEMIEDGELQRHTRRMRRIYAARRDALASALRSELGDALEFQVPRGGIALWVRARGIDVDAWAARALARGVAFATAKRYRFDGRPRPYARFGFAALDEAELGRAAKRLALAVRC